MGSAERGASSGPRLRSLWLHAVARPGRGLPSFAGKCTHSSPAAPCPNLLPSHVTPQVAKSVEYVQAGTTHLVAAKRLQKNTRKWMCCGLILLLIVAAAIAIPIAIKLSK